MARIDYEPSEENLQYLLDEQHDKRKQGKTIGLARLIDTIIAQVRKAK